MYFPATYSFFPVWNVAKLVVTMHDTLPLTHPELVFPQPERAARLAAQGAGRGALGRPDRDGLRGLAPAIQAWSGLARPQDPRDHRGPRPDLPAPRPASPRPTPSCAGSAIPARRALSCSMSAA